MFEFLVNYLSYKITFLDLQRYIFFQFTFIVFLKLYISKYRYNFISEKKQFIQDILKAHNYYRAFHNSPNLVLDEEVNNNIFYLFSV